MVITIQKMELTSDGYVHITVNVLSNNHNADAPLHSFNGIHQGPDNFSVSELNKVKGVKTFYGDDTPIRKPDLSSTTGP